MNRLSSDFFSHTLFREMGVYPVISRALLVLPPGLTKSLFPVVTKRHKNRWRSDVMQGS